MPDELKGQRSFSWHRASGLNLVVASIVLWNTVYLERAVAAIRQTGQSVSDEALAHLSPLKWNPST